MKPAIKSKIVEELVETGTLRSFRVIDSHGHMGAFSGIWFPNPEPEDMLRTLDRCGVEWLAFAHHDAMQDPVRGNQKAQAAIDAHPDRFLGYYAVNPHYAAPLRSAVENFNTLRGFAGYKILAAYYNTAITLDACKPLWEHAHEDGLPVLLHTWGGDACAGCGPVREIAQRYPNARIIMGHAQYGDWDKAIALSREFPNVYCELTAAYAVNGVIAKMVNAGIEDRILFGTDLPWFDPMYAIGCVVFSDISDTARWKILRGNAEGVFKRWIG